MDVFIMFIICAALRATVVTSLSSNYVIKTLQDERTDMIKAKKCQN